MTLLLNKRVGSLIFVILFSTVSTLVHISSSSTENADNLEFYVEYQDVEINDLLGEPQNWTWAKDQGICTGNGIENDPYIIEDILFTGTGFCLSILNSIKYFIIRNCTISGNLGLSLSDVSNGQIIDSNIIYNDQEGINIDTCSSILVSGNNIADNGAGILINDCTFTSLSNNNIRNNDGEGIHLEKANNNIVISENDIRNNTQEGIMIDKDSYNNTIRGNEISYNTLGVHIKGPAADYNLFYENFFRNNTSIAKDDNANTIWNTTLIGNYWDNYDGVDANGDGIGDTPYTIPGTAGNLDYLPIWDDIAPIIIINSPNPNDVFGNSAPNFDVTITEPNLDEMWYTLDSGLHNYTSEEIGTIDQSAWDATSEGNITLTFYAIDKLGNIGSAGVIIIKDVLVLTITINSPDAGEVFGNDTPSFDITVTGVNLDTVWYTLNGSIPYYIDSFSGTINQTEWSALAEGNITLTFYANDSIGNLASEEVNIVKSFTADTGPNLTLIIVLSTTLGGAAVAAGVIGTLMYKGKIKKPEWSGKIKKPEWLRRKTD